ncbi:MULTISPECIES: diacylglycerol kinase family protein [unclassified Knoellia]|uniref:diacylglycerol kinase family protein n=1 Tax=Knoellia altitudinis TaxID=3404795 RepID=UPI0036203FA7
MTEHLCGVVVHPGKPRSAAAVAALRRATRQRGWPEPIVLETSAGSPGAEQVADLLGRGVDRLVAIGGDGTVRDVAAALSLAGHTADRVALGVIPTGTANLWARTIGVHGSLDLAADVAVDGSARDCDLAWVTLTRADGSTQTLDVAVVAGVGMDAEAFAATRERSKEQLGWAAYFAALLRRAAGAPIAFAARLDSRPTTRVSARTVLIGNCRVLPLGLPLMPSASMTDGRLDVLVVSPRSVLGWVGVGVGVLSGRRGGWTGMRTHRARHVVLELDEPTAVHVDGDPVGEAVRLELGVSPAAVLVRGPAGAAPLDEHLHRLLADPARDLGELADALHRGRRWSSDHAREHLVRDAFLSLRGADLTRFKSLLSSGSDHRDLEHLVFDVVDDEGARQDILDHIAAEAAGIDVPDLHVLSDIDDTLRCALHDDRYPRGTVYPGVIALYRALDAGHSGDPERPGDLTFVTARPMDPAGLIEQHTRRGLRELGLPPHAVLSGTFDGLRNHDSMAGAKIENFERFRRLMPETHVVFIGDSGQGDVEVGRRMIASDPDAVRLVLIHDVVSLPDEKRAALRSEGIVIVDTPVGGAIEAYAAGLVSAAGLASVVDAAQRDVTRIAWESPEQEKATTALLERDLDSARAAYPRQS